MRPGLLVALILTIWILAGAVAVWYSQHAEHLKLSYLSYAAACLPSGAETVKAAGGVIAGQATAIANGSTKIEIFVPPEQIERYRIASKHERCHEVQHSEGRLNTCGFYFPRILDEFECYRAQEMEDELYRERYGEWKKG
jgi:hypothetical protein